MAQTDPAAAGRQAALLAGLANEGISSTNTDILFRWVFPDINNLNTTPDYPGQAKNLVNGLASLSSPQVLFASCYPTMQNLLNNTSSIPIIYAGLFHDDTGGGTPPNSSFGNNVGGIYSHQFDVCAQWVALLKVVLPELQAIAVIYDGTNTGAADKYVSWIQKAAGAIPLTKITINLNITQANIQAQLTNFLKGGNTTANSGLIVPAGALIANWRSIIIQLVNALKLPAIYPNRMYIENSPPGFMSCGAVLLDQYLIAGLAVANTYKAGGGFKSFTTRNTNWETIVSQSQATALGFTSIPPNAVVVA